MSNKVVEKYYLQLDYNCAESVLLAANETLGLGLGEEDYKLISAYGAGMGCGRTCGAVLVALGIMGKLMVSPRAHSTPDFGPKCQELVELLERELGSTVCAELKPIYKTEDRRCIATVEKVLGVLTEHLKSQGLIK